MNHSFNNDSLDSGTSHDYAGGHSSDLGYNQQDNLNSDHNWQDLSQQHLDPNGGWGLQDDNFYQHSRDSQMSGLTDLQDNSYSQGLISDNSHYPQLNEEYSLGSQGYGELPDYAAFGSQRLNYSDDSVYTTINNHGMVYKHADSSHSYWVGDVDGRSVYNTSHHYLGYAGTDGKIYDNYDHCVGWVEGDRVYNTSGVEVYETHKGVVGGAAYMLLVYYGGVN